MLEIKYSAVQNDNTSFWSLDISISPNFGESSRRSCFSGNEIISTSRKKQSFYSNNSLEILLLIPLPTSRYPLQLLFVIIYPRLLSKCLVTNKFSLLNGILTTFLKMCASELAPNFIHPFHIQSCSSITCTQKGDPKSIL